VEILAMTVSWGKKSAGAVVILAMTLVEVFLRKAVRPHEPVLK
jgi:hypothetical protein